MSRYTTQVRWICETAANQSNADITAIVSAAAPKIFDNYPIFDESYRPQLNAKILKHYYTREIGEETVELWKFRLNTRMEEIMPYYNELYRSATFKFNPLYTVDMTTTHQRTADANSNTLSTNTAVDTRNSSSFNSKSAGNETSERIKRDAKASRTADENSNDSYKSGKNSSFTGESVQTNNSAADSTNQTQNTAESSGSGSTTNTKTQRDLYSDTPQGSINTPSLDNGTYLTNARVISGSESGTNTSKQETANVGTTTQRETATGTNKNVETHGDVSTENTERNIGRCAVESNANTEDSTSTYAASTVEHGNTSDEETQNSVRTANEKTANTAIESFVEHVVGKTAGVSYSSLIKEFRETLINIDKMIIDELSDLFFGLLI